MNESADQCQIKQLSLSLNQYLLSTCHVPGTELGWEMLGPSWGIKRTLTAQAAGRALLLPEGPEEEAKTSVILSGELALPPDSLAV